MAGRAAEPGTELAFDRFPDSSALRGAHGYSSLRQLREREFGRLAETVYLDHAGATLFPQSQLTNFTKDLMENVYGNPHSQNITSKLTYDTVEQVRYRILAHFHTTPEDYSVIFTSGCTAALRLVAEAFPWVSLGPESSGSHFCYLTDNHTSVVGMRKVAAAKKITFIPIRPEDMWLAEERDASVCDPDCQLPHLFCYPAQSNFSGTRYPLSWIEEVKSGRMSPMRAPGKWSVLLDAASYVSTAPLDLSAHQADFVPISFYKIFGFPTGLGALLVNNRVAPLLRKSYFGGGTAAAYLAGEDFYVPRPSVAERFEDGTISYLDVVALKHGFDALERLTGGMENITHHTFMLAQHTHAALSSLHYPNGAPVVQIYSDSDFSSPDVQGPIINFNVLDDSGNIIGYSQVDKMASLYNIHLRTGCFCNTGACQRHLGLSDEMVKKHLQAGHVCGDDVDLINGQPTGSVRISFGYMSTLEDAQAFLKFIKAMCLHSPDGQPVPQDSTKEAGDLSAEGKAHSMPAVTGRCYLSPQKGACSDHGVCNDSHSAANTVGMYLSLSEATSTQQTVPQKAPGTLHGDLRPYTVTNLYLYPIKSCAAFEVTTWPVGIQGLLYDRSWMVVNHNGICLSQKQEPRLCLIRPFIDLQQGVMVIRAKGSCVWTLPVPALIPAPVTMPSPSWQTVPSSYEPKETIPPLSCFSPGFWSRQQVPNTVTTWPVGIQGLLYDRSWMVVNHNGICLSQKQEPRLCLIRPFIDLQQGVMVIRAKGMEPIEVPLEEDSGQTQICQSKVCADRVNTYDCGEKISSWLSKFFGRPCHLIKQSSNFQRNAKKKPKKDLSPGPAATLSLVNEAQYLLINTLSVLELQQQLNASAENGKEEVFPMTDLISRFRANIITNGTRAFEEEKWHELSIGSLHFQVVGPCHRCQMICIDQQTGCRNQDVFQKLSESRRRKVNFGIYLMHESLDLSSPCFLSVGSEVRPVLKENVEGQGSPASQEHQGVTL